MKDFTDITVILDRSGSMSSVREATIEGFDKFVESQKEIGDNASLTLVQFDDVYEMVWNSLPINTVPSIKDVFKPRGCTALLDAIGKTINDVGSRLAKMKEKDRPNKVVVVVITDGCENASKEFNNAKITDMIRHQEDKYLWKFVFLGANQDAIASATSLGISANYAATYNATSSGTSKSFDKMGAKFAAMRSCCSSLDFDSAGACYSAEDKDELLKS